LRRPLDAAQSAADRDKLGRGRFIEELPFSITSKTAAAAWRDGQEAARTGALKRIQNQDVIPETALKTHAAEQAKRHMDEAMQRLSLTPAQGVRLFTIYVRIFMNGVFDQAAKQAEQAGE
jgi:hypothetical protein